MADALPAARGQNSPPRPEGKNRVTRFVTGLKANWVRKSQSKREKCEDLVKINAWFKLVENTYGIAHEHIYNFDVIGFMMGEAATSQVVTSVDTIGRATVVQPGNREWVTAIECISASGWSLPPFLILAGEPHEASQYKDLPPKDLPPKCAIALSPNGWTTNELGLEWLKHFNEHTGSDSEGAYRLLILDDHESYATPEFVQFCKDNKIFTLCLPRHTSHLLQPLYVGCYPLFKAVYEHEVSELARQGFFHIDKLAFLQIYRRMRQTALFEDNVQTGFVATGLILSYPNREPLSGLAGATCREELSSGIQASAETLRIISVAKQLDSYKQLWREGHAEYL